MSGDAHSLIGASSIARLIACPASFGLSQQVALALSGAARLSSIYAATGTVAHALAEEALTDGYDPASQLDETVIVDGHEITVTPDMVEAVRVYVAEVSTRSAGASFFALETRVCLDPYWPAEAPPPVSAFGTADTIAYHGLSQHLDVIDYKNGAGVFVDVTDNPQLNYYAAGALLEVPGPVLTIDLTIVQPNVRGSEKVRTFRTSAVDVMIWVDDVLKPTIAEATMPGARISAGKQCRWCPARAGCPALAGIAQDLARRDFGPSPGQPVLLNDAELGRVLTDMDLVAVHVDAQREIAQAKIMAGVPVPGWEVVPSRPVRGWSVPPDVLEAALAASGIEVPERIVFDRTRRTPAAVEKLLSPGQWAVVQPYVQSKSSGVRLVPTVADPAESNSGRAAAQDDFAKSVG